MTPPASTDRMGPLGQSIWLGLKLIGRGLVRFFNHGGLNQAAAVAFFAILSLIPFFFIVVSIAGRVIGHSERAHLAIRAFLDKVIPYYSDILMGEVSKITISSGYHGVFGLLFMIWVGSLVFDSLDYAMNVVFQAQQNRSYLKTKLMSFAIFPAAGMVLILSLFLTAVFSALGRLPSDDYLPAAVGPAIEYIVSSGLTALPYLMLIGVLMILYRVVPAVKVSYAQALAGALLCSFGWAIEKWLFGLVILPNRTYGVVYGSLKAMIILILWIYFAMCLVLISAEVVAAYRAHKEETAAHG